MKDNSSLLEAVFKAGFCHGLLCCPDPQISGPVALSYKTEVVEELKKNLREISALLGK